MGEARSLCLQEDTDLLIFINGFLFFYMPSGKLYFLCQARKSTSFQSSIFMLQWICIISDSFPMDTMIVYLIYLQSEVLNRFKISLVYQTFYVKVSSFTQRNITRIEKRFSLGKSVSREWSLKVISYHYLFKCFSSSNTV